MMLPWWETLLLLFGILAVVVVEVGLILHAIKKGPFHEQQELDRPAPAGGPDLTGTQDGVPVPAVA